MRLELQLGGTTLHFVEPTSLGAYPWLIAVGTLAVAARATHLDGTGSTEAPSLTVELDNTGRQAAGLVGRPLRAAAKVFDDGASYFVGTVSSVAYGPTLALTIES